MPMIALDLGAAVARCQRRHSVRIVEPDKPFSVRIVQREGVAQPVRALRRRCHAAKLEFEPVAPFEVMDAAIKRQQKFKRVFVGYSAPSLCILSSHDTTNLARGSSAQLQNRILEQKRPILPTAPLVPKFLIYDENECLLRVGSDPSYRAHDAD